MPNDLLVTTTDILGIEVAKEYSGASGIYVDNENNVISITGEVGKEYNGIEPIVVNNEENLISANSAPIGVQEPLYFVQDDDEAVIIGLSGEYVTPSDITGKLDTSSFEGWQQGQYTNDLTAINEKINEVSSNIPSLEGYATEQWVEDKGYLTAVSIPESATWEDTSEVVKTNSGTWDTVTDKLDVTAQVISSCETSSVDDKTLVTKLNGNEIAVSYAGSAHVADIALKDYQGNSFIPFYAKTSALEDKLDTTAFSTVSGDFLTAHQSLSDYYTKNETSGKEELAQAFANIPGGDTEVNAYVHNSSASIDESTNLVQSNSSTWNDITAYQSNSASYQPSGNYIPYTASNTQPNTYDTNSALTIHSNQNILYLKPALVEVTTGPLSVMKRTTIASGGITAQNRTTDDATFITPNSIVMRDGTANKNALIDCSSVGNWNDVSETVQSNSATWGQGGGGSGDEEVNQAVHTNSATWNTVTDKLDTTAFSDVSGSFLTAHQSLDGYATETLVEETSGAITSLIPTDYYPDTNPSGFISGVDLSPYQTIEGMTAYQPVGDYATTGEVDTLSSMLSAAIDYVSANAGDEFPISADEAVQYVQTNSAGIDDTVNNVQTNSGVWGGSALPISAGPGIKVNLVDNTLVFSNDETVLFTTADINKTTAFTLSEPLTAFEKVRFEITGYTNVYAENTHQTPSANNEEITTCFTYYCKSSDGNPLQMMMGTYSSNDGLNYGVARSKFLYMSNDGTTWNGNTTDGPHLQRIIGINRK